MYYQFLRTLIYFTKFTFNFLFLNAILKPFNIMGLTFFTVNYFNIRIYTNNKFRLSN